MHDPATLAAAVRSTLPLMLRYLSGFSDENRCEQPEGVLNHASWIIGHCALTMQRAADRVEGFDDAQPLSTTDWVVGDGTAGDPSRYDTESVSYGSKPVPATTRYPRFSRSVQILGASSERLASLAEASSPKSLSRETTWGSGLTTPGDLVPRILFHNGTHTGQLIVLRRTLAMPPAVG